MNAFTSMSHITNLQILSGTCNNFLLNTIIYIPWFS